MKQTPRTGSRGSGSALALAACLAAGCAAAARADDAFPFLIPGFDAVPAATDVSTLSPRPAGKEGRVSIRDGLFVDGRGERLRILGVNFSFGANFPEPSDAEKLAAHLAKLGINGVRHHHMDARDIWRQKPDGTRDLDPEKLDRLAYLISQLGKNGIYSNINLHVSRSVTKAEGFPDADQLPGYNKYILYFDERLQAMLKEYARGLLTHRSPRTGRRILDEPSLAFVEITNENRFTVSGLGPLWSLPERYQREFQRRWNVWLRKEYKSTDALKKAWGAGSEPMGDDIGAFGDLARSAEPWSLSARGGNRARLEVGQPGPDAANSAMRVAIEEADGVLHQLELVYRGLTLEKGKLYTASFWIRAERPRSVYVDVSRDGDPWRPVGLGETIDATPRWQEVVIPFRATETLEERARWIFKLGDSDTDIWLADLHLRRGGELSALDPESTLKAGTIPVPRRSLQKAVADDVTGFMEATETAFFAEMHRFLTEEIGVEVPVSGSQARWQALSAFEPLDFVDAHAYWEHPRFPRRPWDARDWLIPNQPMVRVPGNDALTRLAWLRVWGKPYTVSEYNHPAPNDYQIECVPLLCAIAALQDWDGVYVYSYQHGSESWESDRIQRFFDINGNPAKLALMHLGAMLFRRGDLRPAERELSVRDATGPTRGDALRHRVGTDLASEDLAAGVPAPEEKRFESDTGEIRWEADDPARARFLVLAPRTQMALGFIGENEIQLPGLYAKTAASPRNFGIIALTSLDGEPIAVSRRMLFTTLASAENRGMEWNEDRTSVSDRWGTSPPMVTIVPAVVTIDRDERRVEGSWKAYPLDPTGARRDPVHVRATAQGLMFRADPGDRTIWYELVRE